MRRHFQREKPANDPGRATNEPIGSTVEPGRGPNEPEIREGTRGGGLSQVGGGIPRGCWDRLVAGGGGGGFSVGAGAGAGAGLPDEPEPGLTAVPIPDRIPTTELCSAAAIATVAEAAEGADVELEEVQPSFQ